MRSGYARRKANPHPNYRHRRRNAANVPRLEQDDRRRYPASPHS